jgi:hypothetical protein
VDLALEFSVFHIRYPGESKGIVTGLIVKDLLHVTGDGKKTLANLVAEHASAKYKQEEMKKRHEANWQKIIPANENYFLSMAGNHIHGAKFINLNHEIDQRLCDVFDRISHEAGQFYFGRYDLKCTSLEDLKAGKNIQILEFNGAGAAITHVLDRNMSYGAALKEIVRHWRHLYRIGKINHKKGVPYWSFMKGYRFMQKAKKNFKRMQEIDKTLILYLLTIAYRNLVVLRVILCDLCGKKIQVPQGTQRKIQHKVHEELNGLYYADIQFIFSQPNDTGFILRFIDQFPGPVAIWQYESYRHPTGRAGRI